MLNYDNYNVLIDKYINQKTVKSAILLTAPWGSGKSYYVEEVLTKFLNEKNIDVINISLYGLNNTGEVTSLLVNRLALYNQYFKKLSKFEIVDVIKNSAPIKMIKGIPIVDSLLKRIKEKKEIGNIAFSVLGNKIGCLTSSLCERFNIKINNTDLKNIIKLIKDNKNLVVFEDVERSNISIVDLLGYVNNLVNDVDIKILLVANENVFLKQKDFEDMLIKRNSNELKKEENEEIEKYKEYKEKTVSDTIKFYASEEETIKSITSHFDNTYELKNNKFLDYFENILKVMKDRKCRNYRILIFALQKVVDYFDESINKRDKRFFWAVTYSILRFSIQIRENRKSDDFESDSILGIGSLKQYVEGDYSVVQHIDYFEKSYIEYLNGREKNQVAENLLGKINNWFNYKQEELENLICEIKKRIEEDAIGCNYYNDFMYYMLPLKGILENNNDIEDCKELCLSKLKDIKVDISGLKDYDFGYDFFIEGNNNNYKEYITFKNECKTIIENRTDITSNVIDYSDLDKFCESIRYKKSTIHSHHSFMNKIDIDKLTNVIICANPKAINNFRRLLKEIYDVVNIKEIYPNDDENLNKLKINIDLKKNDVKDKVAKCMIGLLGNELADYCKLF